MAYRKTALWAGIAATASSASIAMAQEAPADETAGLQDIVVTARKRSESDLVVPISMQAYDAEELERRGVQSLKDIASITPGVIISNSVGSFGGNIMMRGISTASAAIAINQAVAIIVDGVPARHGTAVRLGQFDIEQVTVMKGPQSLFFGKSTAAGAIDIKSAAPTRDFDSMSRVGYDFNSDEIRTEAYVSGPISESLRGRVSGLYGKQKGYFRNALPADFAGEKPRFRRVNDGHELGLRMAFDYDPAEPIFIKFRGTYAERTGQSSYDYGQLVFCQNGVPNLANPINAPGIGECKVDRTVYPSIRAVNAAETGIAMFGNGDPFEKQKQYQASLEANFDVRDDIALTSQTGFYRLEMSERGCFGPNFAVSVCPTYANSTQAISQEFRIATSFAAPLNGMIGLYHSNGQFDVNQVVYLFGSIPPQTSYKLYDDVWAAFGQLTLAPIETVELSAGARYTHEPQRRRAFAHAAGWNVITGPVNFQVDKITMNVLTPELSATWRPNQKSTIYVTWKKGAKSGGFDVTPTIRAPYDIVNASFNEETATGFEGGAKLNLLDNSLRLNVSSYTYKYNDYQVATVVRLPDGTGLTETRNAASVVTKGVEVSGSYVPRFLENLSINGGINYNDAQYSSFPNARCFTGQTAVQGCNASGLQDLSGRQLLKAPKWTGSIAGNFESALDDSGIWGGVALGATYTSSYSPLAEDDPRLRQRSQWTLDGSLRLFNDNNGWELALIGKNLTNSLRVQYASGAPRAPGDYFGYTNNPRAIALRLTVHPQKLAR